MSKEEFLAMLRDNLTIQATVDTDWSSFGGETNKRLTVKLMFGDEEICEDSTGFEVGEKNPSDGSYY